MEKKLAAVKNELGTAPDGYIRVSKKHKCPQYYLIKNRNDRNGKYMNKNQLPLVKSILLRDYNKKLKRELELQIKVLKKAYKKYSLQKLYSIFENTPPSRRLQIVPKFIPVAEFVQNWENTSYIHKTLDETEPFLTTIRGEKVRSKSENMIADVLFRLKIPYRYEAPVKIGTKIFYPDFTCLNARTRTEYIWEHFGLLQNPEYAANAVGKLRLYNKYGYYSGENLIVSSETKESPLNSNEIEKLAKKYLL